jgi:hypothetical protein
MLHITPEFHKLCKASFDVLPLELGSFEALMTLSPQSSTSLVSGAVVKHSSDALFAKELCDLLASLEAVSPRYGKDIDCILAGQASEDLIMKVENSLKKVIIKGKRRKRGVGRKFFWLLDCSMLRGSCGLWFFFASWCPLCCLLWL